MEEINQNILRAEKSLAAVLEKPGNAGPQQLALLKNLIDAVARLALMVESQKTPSA